MMRVVHQIWIGSAMPEAERGWVAGVRRVATAAGWEHRLWGWEELLEAFGAEPVADVFRRAFALPGEVISPAVVASLACDYYRSRVLAEHGGVYLDCDFECRGEWPNFEELLAAAGVEVLGLEEFFSPVMCAGFYAVTDGRAMRLATDVAAEYLLRVMPPDAVDFATRLVAECRRDGGRGGLAQHGVGPGWRRRVVLPMWERAGVRWAFVPRALLGHRQWGGGAALVHMGAARWHEQSGTALAALWQQRAHAAREMSAPVEGGGEEASADAVAAVLPPWMRPQSTRVLPQVLRRGVAVDGAAVSRGLFVPPGTRRVVIFSNVPGLDARAMVREGDFCVHINRARYFPALRGVAGLRHALVVRRGQDNRSGRPVWFEPPSTAGFEQVVRVLDIPMRARRRWWQEYCRENPGKCPTTGFICWRWAQEAAPGVPVVLAGFNPSADCGTYRWPHHAWEYEDRVYKQAGVHALPPRKNDSLNNKK